MNYTQPISELLDDVRKIYVDKQRNQGIRASGKSADSIRKEAKPLEGALYGAMYFRQQKIGRRPGKFPPIDDILDWIRVKGIQPRDSKTTERQLAFLFARKIAQSGTDVFQGKREGLDVDDAIEVRLQKFFRDMAKGFKKEIVEMLQQE